MSSAVRSWQSLGGDKEQARHVTSGGGGDGDIVKMGYLKKLKTMKKKFFVLRGDSSEASARLEYYDSEKKFKTNHVPKRSITLKTCFNINKRCDTRQKWVIALYTKNDCFCLVMETEEELEDWLKMLLKLQHGEDVPDGEQPKPTFEHVWQVTVQKKELGHSRNILGPYLLCLTDRTLSLVKMDSDSEKPDTIEFSLQSIRRCGDLESFFYMEVGQMSVTGAGNLWMQTEDNNIAQNMHAAILSACRNCKDFVPMSRIRSHSTNESSRPISVSRPSHDGHSRVPGHFAINNNNNNSNNNGSAGGGNNNNNNNNNNPVLVGGCGGTGGNAGGGVVVGMHQRTYSFPLSPIPPSRRASTGTRPNKKPTTSHSLSGVRERCDSLPTRPRTTSEGATTHIPQHPPRGTHLRPHSMYNRTISYSPPVDSSPVSPESRASTDSAGSSLSMEGDGMGLGDGTWESGPDRYGHSLTPEEPVIMEENSDECENVNIHWHPGDDYVGPDKQICPSLTNHLPHKNSPNPSSSGFRSSSPSQGSLADMCSPCGSSPLETSGAYMPMSPGEKPIIMPNNFGGLRTGISSVNHSRGSSLAEDGYVHMAPMLHDDGYVDMGQGVSAGHHRRNIPDHYRSGDLSPASSCSITSGTPSTDIRFSEYNLEKVSTYITPSEDEIVPSERPARAYSVGSRPTFNKRNDVVNQSECQQRVRAFSVGSRCPRVHTAHLTPPPRHPLSSSHSSVEHQEDLMEMDFTKNNKSRSRLYSKKPSSSERLSVPPSSVASSAASSYSTAEGSYMEMSPRSSPKPSDNEMDSSHFCPSPPKSNRITIGRSPPKSYMDMKPSFSSSPPVTGGLGHSSIPLYKVPEGESGYVEMSTGCRSELTGSSPPVVISQLSMRDDRGRSLSEDSSYMEMNPIETRSIIAKASAPRVDSFPVTEQFKQQSFSKPSNSPPIKQALISTSNILKTKANQDDYLDMNAKRKYSLVEDNNNKIVIGRTNPIDTPKKTPDGYVEMTLGNLKPIRKSSLESIKVGDSDYMNMSGGGKKERRGSRKDRNRYSSQPITIQSTASIEQSSSTSPVFTFVGRKHSTGTPPKVPSYLPLGNYSTSPSSSPYSSLGRRTRKTPSRRDSKELSSSGCSTPIFPLSLNSPSSPMKPFNQGSNNNNNNNSNTTNNNNNNSNSKDKESYESAAKCPVDATSGTVRISYSPADHPLMPHPLRQQSSGVANYVEQNDYVNFNPLISELKESSSCSDYTPMKPVNPLDSSRKISAPPVMNNFTGKTRSIDKLVTGMNNLTVSSPEINSVPKNNSNHNSNNCSNISNSNMCTVTVTVTSANNVVTDETRFNSVETVSSTCISEINSSSSSKCNSDIVVLSSDKISANVCDSGIMVALVATTAAATSDSSFVPSISPTVLINSTASVTTGVNQNVTAINSLTSATNAANSSSAAATASTGNNSTVPTSTTTVTTTAITGDKELHYASLDLVRSSSVEETSGSNATSSSSNANRPLRNQSSTSSASTPSPNINQNTAPALMYAEIDFSKSGSSSSNSNNTNSTVH